MLGFDETYTIEPFALKINHLKRKCKQELWPNSVPYEIHIGEWNVSLGLEDYDTDLDAIRHAIERYVFDFETEIKLMDEVRPCVINLKRCRVLKPEKYSRQPWVDRYADVVRIKVKTNLHNDSYDKIAYCDEKACIGQLYFPLLYFAKVGCLECHGNEFKNHRREYSRWRCSPLVFYNIIKSPIIEAFLSGQKRNAYEVFKRQVEIRAIYTINPDYCATLYHDTEGVYDGPDKDDSLEFYNHEDNLICKIVVPGILAWCNEFNSVSPFGNEYKKFDWTSWHKRGLELAKEMRQKLSDNVVLWYEHPFEEHTMLEPMLLIKNYESIKLVSSY